MKEQRFNIHGDEIYVLHSEVISQRQTIVCIPGLGESHVCFAEAFEKLNMFNVVVIDLAGYGNSTACSARQYDTRTQAGLALQVVDRLNIITFTLIGHSWGGDVGTHMCDIDAKQQRRIKQFINVEGGIHCQNIIMSGVVSQKFAELGESAFERWVQGDEFANDLVLSWGMAAGIRYLASARMCDARVFGQTATEIAQLLQTKDEQGVVEWGWLYASLDIPKVYCWGESSLAEHESAKKFIHQLNHKPFSGTGHWVMMDACEAFYSFVCGYVLSADK